MVASGAGVLEKARVWARTAEAHEGAAGRRTSDGMRRDRKRVAAMVVVRFGGEKGPGGERRDRRGLGSGRLLGGPELAMLLLLLLPALMGTVEIPGVADTYKQATCIESGGHTKYLCIVEKSCNCGWAGSGINTRNYGEAKMSDGGGFPSLFRLTCQIPARCTRGSKAVSPADSSIVIQSRSQPVLSLTPSTPPRFPQTCRERWRLSRCPLPCRLVSLAILG